MCTVYGERRPFPRLIEFWLFFHLGFRARQRMWIYGKKVEKKYARSGIRQIIKMTKSSMHLPIKISLKMNQFSNKRILGKSEAFSRPDDLSWATDRRKKRGAREKKTFQSSPPPFLHLFFRQEKFAGRGGHSSVPAFQKRGGTHKVERWQLSY